MKILVTGGLGFLGHHIVEHFLKKTDATVVVLDKMTYASSGFDRLRDISVFDDARVHVLGCDISRPMPEGVAREIGEVDYIIHAAAETHVDNSIVDPLPFIETNVMGTHHLLMWMRTLKSLRRAIVVSTDEVYGPASLDDKENAFDEEAPMKPANPYAATKAGAENIVRAYANTYKLPLMIAATMNLVGERQHYEKMVPKCIRAALLGEKMIIHADPSRTRSGTRFYLHCRTYAHALGFLIDQDQAGIALPPKVNICGEREIANIDLAQLIASYVEKPIACELTDFHSSRPGHDLAYRMRDDLIRSLGWKRPMNLEQSLEKTVRWYLANPKWLGL